MALFGKLGSFLETAAPFVAPLIPGLGAATPFVQAASGAELARRAQKQLAQSYAVSTPTPAQAPQAALETAMSSEMYQPYTAGFAGAGQIGSAIGGAMLESAVDFIPDITVSKFFGNGGVCAVSPRQAPITVRADGCITVTRKQQAALKRSVELLGIAAVAESLNLSAGELAALMLKRFPPRRKGISGAQLKNAKRVNRTIMGMAKELQDACKTTTYTRRRK